MAEATRTAAEDARFQKVHDDPRFDELRKRYRNFVFPATIAFLAWYLLYVVMSNWAEGFMNTQLIGHINVALVFGLLQFATTFGLAFLYAKHSSKVLDPIARDLLSDYDDEVEVAAAATRKGGL